MGGTKYPWLTSSIEFDKRTSLGVSKTFHSTIQPQGFLSRDVAKDICAQMSQQLVTVVPQLNDYLCPVCFCVAYRPVRLHCRHVFCIRCIVKIQRRNEKYCPLCRADVVMSASAGKIPRFLSLPSVHILIEIKTTLIVPWRSL